MCRSTRKNEETNLIKVAPDLSDEELEAIVDAAIQSQIDGIVATNTTLSRPNKEHPVYIEQGGCSGCQSRTGVQT